MDTRSGGNTSPAHKCALNRRKATNYIRGTENTEETGNVSEDSLTPGLRWMRVHSGTVGLACQLRAPPSTPTGCIFGAQHGANPPDSWSRETNECLMIHAWWCDVTQCSSYKTNPKTPKEVIFPSRGADDGLTCHFSFLSWWFLCFYHNKVHCIWINTLWELMSCLIRVTF